MDNQNKNTQKKAVKKVKMPPECGQSEKEIESISDESVITHYAFINLIVIAIIGLITAASFVVLTSDDKVDDSENPLTLKSFASGKFSSNMQKSYNKTIPFSYELKNADNRISLLFGIGNEIKNYEKHQEIILISDEEVEQEKQKAKDNVEQAMNESSDESSKEVTTKKTTKASETTTKSTTAKTQSTTTQTTTTTTQTTTSLTTTNNEPPEALVITTTAPEGGE